MASLTEAGTLLRRSILAGATAAIVTSGLAGAAVAQPGTGSDLSIPPVTTLMRDIEAGQTAFMTGMADAQAELTGVQDRNWQGLDRTIDISAHQVLRDEGYDYQMASRLSTVELETSFQQASAWSDLARIHTGNVLEVLTGRADAEELASAWLLTTINTASVDRILPNADPLAERMGTMALTGVEALDTELSIYTANFGIMTEEFFGSDVTLLADTMRASMEAHADRSAAPLADPFSAAPSAGTAPVADPFALPEPEPDRQLDL